MLFVYVLTEGLLFFLPDVVLYHIVSNLQLFSLGWTDLLSLVFL
jgi:hypothetical protein